MKQFRARFFLNSGPATYLVTARDPIAAYVAAYQAAERDHGPAQEGEDVYIDELVNDQWKCNVDIDQFARLI